jgi:hypothetical protein
LGLNYRWHGNKLSLNLAGQIFNIRDKGAEATRKKNNVAFKKDPTRKESNHLTVGEKTLNWNKDEWYFLTLTWSVENSKEFVSKLYVNGELLKTQRAGFKNHSIGNSSVFLVGRAAHSGSADEEQHNSGSLFSVDCFRVSNSVRSEEEIKHSFDQGFQKDNNTLLFDNFSTAKIKSKKWKRKDVLKAVLPKSGTIKAVSGQVGTVFGPAKSEKGKFGGQTIKLFVE